MIKPFCQDDPFLADVAGADVRPEQFHLWWLGQSGFLLKWKRRFLLFDPYLSDSLTKKYAATDKPHVRMTERVVEPGRLNFVHVVTASHEHTDHLDPETLQPLLESIPQLRLVIPEAIRARACKRLRIALDRPIGLDAGQFAAVDLFRIEAVPAAHETVERDDLGRCRFLGFIAHFGSWRVYHSGDTVRYGAMAELLREKNISVALLPINGRAPERRVAGNLDGAEAARLAKEIGAGCVIPCHYEMFEFNTASPDLFARECERLGQPHAVLRAGERWSFPS